MRLAVLTTETSHHAHFVREIAAWAHGAGPAGGLRVFLETRGAAAPFPTAHPFEAERDAFEAAAWFGGRPARCADFAETVAVGRMNDADAVAALAGFRPDAAVVFGTGRLAPAVIAAAGEGRIVNLHGGDPEAYRGLDTHLWAVYHGDFGGLSTTLHHLNPELDDGPVIANLPVPLHRGMALHELRRANTEVCVRLVRQALEAFLAEGRFAARPQRAAGRYYSFMPAVLKELCVGRFARYTARLT